MRMAFVVASLLLLSGCGATVLGENADGIWFREPFIGSGGMESEAQEHCAKKGRTAVYAGTLDAGHGYTLPVVAYDCR